VAAPVRSAAPVRRHQSLMPGLDHPGDGGDLAVIHHGVFGENFLYM
jgi:hypothetical protein